MVLNIMTSQASAPRRAGILSAAPPFIARALSGAVSRTLAGTLGAYGLTALITMALSQLLSRTGMVPVEAVTAATLASFAIFAIASMAIFHARSVPRAWGWLILLAVPVGVTVLLMMPE
jgi:cytosine/uracil/thiamine/allantoin permease